jgi:pantothenate synthetase
LHSKYVCILLIKCLKTQFLECHKWYDSVDELMNRHIMLGNWRMGRFLTAATIVERLFHFVSALVRYIQQSSASLGFS